MNNKTSRCGSALAAPDVSPLQPVRGKHEGVWDLLNDELFNSFQVNRVNPRQEHRGLGLSQGVFPVLSIS